MNGTNNVCPDCDGAGRLQDGSICERCKGTGGVDAVLSNMTTHTESAVEPAADAMLLDGEWRQYLLKAAEHRSRLQQSDIESLFDIAQRLRKTV
jgi:hypothetical protein